MKAPAGTQPAAPVPPTRKAALGEVLRALVAGRLVGLTFGWVALELDPSRIGSAGFWRATAMASPCAVVEYAGDWGEPLRRAFCGNRLRFSESYGLHDLAHMAPGIPFA